MIDVIPIACLDDNYSYLVRVAGAAHAIVVDPSEAGPVLCALQRASVTPSALLCTHHHHDHVGGNDALVEAFPGVRVYGHARDRDRIPRLTDGLEDGDRVVCAGLDVAALWVPGHTLGALAYLIEEAVFTGDTMFHAGAGRLFEGTAEMLYRSLCTVLARLPATTRVYPGHEYTVQNLLFASTALPGDAAVRARLALAREVRARGEPTVGATLAEELATNPFLRCKDAAELARLRRAKDEFRAP